MNENFKSFGETAKGLSKSPLGIIVLFIVLVYGFASLVTAFAGSFTATERLPLIYFLVLFPVLVLMVFSWLVSCHSSKLYSPSDYKNEENYIRMQLNVATSLAAATAKNPEAIVRDADIEKITDAAANITAHGNKTSSSFRQKHILWVDDRPENNVYERKAFEAVGLTFSLALSTNAALDTLKHYKFEAIISDMGRKEGPQEGYVLLEELRKQGDDTPFFIYAGSNLPEHKKEAYRKGAQGSTNNVHELFVSVTDAIKNRKVYR